MFERLRKINTFVGERLQLGCDTIIDITNATIESISPLEQHAPKLLERFMTGQKNLFGKRSAIRDTLLAK